jgi:hypothetical protein
MDIWKVMGHLKNENWFGLGMKCAFAYVGTVVGAGFASGQEILRFFTVYGGYSFEQIIEHYYPGSELRNIYIND